VKTEACNFFGKRGYMKTLKSLTPGIIVLCFLTSFSASCKIRGGGSGTKNSSNQSQLNDDRAIEFALLFYKSSVGDGSEPSAEIDRKEDSVSASIYNIAIQDGPSTVYLEVVVTMETGEITRIKFENFDMAEDVGENSEAHKAAAKALARKMFDFNFGKAGGTPEELEVRRAESQSSNRYTKYTTNLSLDPGGEVPLIKAHYILYIANNGTLVLEIEQRTDLGD
jgi:hypothetical protein